MKKFLTKKWLGPLFLFVYVLVTSLFLVHQITPQLKAIFPVITQEAGAFLPITIQNGEVVQPENALISKTYTLQDGTFNVVLDTRTEKLDLNTLSPNSIYFSRKCVYIVSPEETKERCFPESSSEPIVITEEMVKNLMDNLGEHVDTFLTGVLIISLFLGFYFVILFYTIILHWIIALLARTSFGQTLFINTLLYILYNLVETFTPITLGFWIRVVLFICINVVICKIANRQEYV